MGFSVRGHICIRRKAKDGNPGEAGKSIRTTVWETGKQYYAGDTQVDGVYPLDIVTDKAISIGVSGVNFYMCRTSHTSAASIPLSNTAYWTKLNNLKPVVTYLILAELIKANYIDVQDLAANNAFIENLFVKHLNGADGTFSGGIKIPFTDIASSGHTFMYSEQDSDNPSVTNYHYMFNPAAEPYIRMNAGQYKRVVIHIPNAASMDGKRLVFWDPFMPAHTGTHRCRIVANNLVSLDWRGEMVSQMSYPVYIESMWGGICEILCVWDGEQSLYCNVSDTHYSAVF